MSRVISQAVAPSGVPCSPQVPVRPESRSSHPGALVSLIAALASLGGGFSPWAVPPALLFGGLGLFAAQQAQATDRVLVSTIGQTTASTWYLWQNVPPAGTSFVGTSYAQGFTTGSFSQGYILSDIEVRLRISLTSSRRLQNYRAELWSSDTDGAPQSRLASLRPLASTNSGINNLAFRAPVNTRLTAATTYHLVMYRTDDLNDDQILLPSSTNEDDGGEAGWSIADKPYVMYSSPPSGTWSEENINNLLIRVSGSQVGAVTAPAAPTALSTAVQGFGKLLLSWTAPAGTVTDYEVHYTSSTAVGNAVEAVGTDAAAGWVDVTRTSGNTATSQLLTGLITDGRAYRVRVRAGNKGVASPWVFGSGTPAPVPLGSSWTATLTVQDLTNSIDNGCNSAQANSAEKCSTPTVLTDDTFTVGANSYTVRQIAVSSSGYVHLIFRGALNNQFRALKFCVGTTALDLSGATTIEGNSDDFDFQRSGTSLRWSPGNLVDLFITSGGCAPPPRPVGLSVSPGDRKLDLSWTAPTGTVTGYDVHYTSAAVGTVANDAVVQTGADSAGWVAVDRGTEANPPATSQEITGLTTSTAYRVRVRAKNNDGDGHWLFGTGTPLGLPGEPTRLTISRGDTRLNLDWTAPSDNGGRAITGYDVHYTSTSDTGSSPVANDAPVQTGADPSAAAGWVAVDRGTEANPPATSQEITGLTNGLLYRVRVRAKNELGASGWVRRTGTPASPPPPPPREETPPPVVTIAVVEEEVTEGGAARFTVNATPVPRAGAPLSVRVRVSDSGDFASASQTGIRSITVDESGSAVFSVATEDDDVHEEDGAITATVETGNGYTPHASSNAASVTIRDNDLPVVTIEAVEEEVTEGGEARFTLRATPVPRAGAPLNVRVAVNQRGDVASSNEIGPRTVVVDESGSAVFSVFTEDDAVYEQDGAITAVVEQGTGYTPHASSNSAAVRVRDNDPPTAEQRAWLLRFGRTVSQQVVDALQQRFSTTSSTPSGLQLTVAGESLTSATPLEENHVLLSRLLGFEKVSSQELAQGSSFSFSPEGAGPRLSFWGSGALSSFNGSEDTFNLRGDVTTALVGAEWSSERWRAGAALSHSRGSGSYQGGRGAGDISGALTGLFPYGRYALSPRLGIWATAGYGWGSLSHNPDGYGPEYNPGATMALGAVGMDGLLLEGGSDGVTLTTTADFLLLKTSSQEVEGLPASDGNLSRFRLGLEAGRDFLLSNGSSLSPSLEVGLRQDSGDAETGFGMDLGAGLSWSAPQQGITAAVKGRTLLSHGAEDFQDQGLALSFSWQPSPSNRGASLSLSHAVGLPADGGMAALLNPTAIELPDDASNGGEQFEARLAYGFPFYNNRLTLTPSVATALSTNSRSYSLLWSVAPYGEQLLGEPWELSLEGERQEHSSSSTVDHSLKLLFSLPL